MKRFVLILGCLTFLLATPAYAFTKSVELVPASSQYLSNASIAGPATDMTFEGNFYFKGIAGHPDYQILGGTNTSPGTRNFFFLWCPATVCQTPAVLDLVAYGGGSETFVSWLPTVNTWYHVAITFTGASGDVRFYIDGVQQGTTQNGGQSLTGATGSFFLGALNGTGEYFDGDMSNVKLWSTVRTAGQIGTDKCATLGATSGLLAEWSLDNVLTDNSGNGYTLTNNGSAAFVSNVPTCTAAAPTFSFWQFFGF